MHINADIDDVSSSALIVALALAIIWDRVNEIALGSPVEPLVIVVNSSDNDSHCSINENVEFSNGVLPDTDPWMID
jgi:hypothetical protein